VNPRDPNEHSLGPAQNDSRVRLSNHCGFDYSAGRAVQPGGETGPNRSRSSRHLSPFRAKPTGEAASETRRDLRLPTTGRGMVQLRRWFDCKTATPSGPLCVVRHARPPRALHTRNVGGGARLSSSSAPRGRPKGGAKHFSTQRVIRRGEPCVQVV